MNAWGLLLVVLLAGPVLAESRVYRCEDAKGHRTYQNEPCPPGSREKGAVSYTPDRPPTREELQARRDLDEWQRARSQQNAGTAWIEQPAEVVYQGNGPAAGSREARRQACEAAKAARDAYQFQLGGAANDGKMAWHRKQVQTLCHGL